MIEAVNTIKENFAAFLTMNNVLSDEIVPSQQIKEICDQALKIIPADLLSLFIFDRNSNKLELAYHEGEPSNLVEAVNFSLGKGGAFMAMRFNRVYLVHSKEEVRHNEQLHSFLAIPIRFQRRNLGVFAVGRRFGKKFTRRDVIFGKMISVNLMNLLIFLEKYADSSK